MKRTVLVTGGTRGIGSAISKAFNNKNYTVIATYHANTTAAEEFHKETKIPILSWDIRTFEACQKSIHQITQLYGPIDILVNNAGITRDGFLHKSTLKMWEEVITTNLTSCYNTTRCVIEAMRERNFGRIINISSINGQRGQIGQTNYAAAKAGIIGFTKALALETASKGITVNAIAPGYIDTEMMHKIPQEVLNKIIAQVPTARLGLAEEVAHAVTFLAADESGYITGATLNLNGGLYMA